MWVGFWYSNYRRGLWGKCLTIKTCHCKSCRLIEVAKQNVISDFDGLFCSLGLFNLRRKLDQAFDSNHEGIDRHRSEIVVLGTVGSDCQI